MRKILLLVLFVASINSTFSQTYKGSLKLSSPRTNGPEVLAVQQRLLDLGFSKVGDADGWFGPLTKDEVSNFQRFYGFNETGIVDSVLWNSLFNESKKQTEIESAIREANTKIHSKLTKSSHDIMDRSTEGGNVVQYLSFDKIAIEEFRFFGEMGKVEYKVIHVADGLVVLEKDYQYPEPFDIDHATIANTAYYFLAKISAKITTGKIENSEMESLSIHDLIKQ